MSTEPITPAAIRNHIIAELRAELRLIGTRLHVNPYQDIWRVERVVDK